MTSAVTSPPAAFSASIFRVRGEHVGRRRGRGHRPIGRPALVGDAAIGEICRDRRRIRQCAIVGGNLQ
jgi:hypothetical protein